MQVRSNPSDFLLRQELFGIRIGLHFMDFRSLRLAKKLAAIVGMAAGALVLAVPASAHVEASPALIKPSAPTTVTLTVKHGCAGSPTTKLAVKAPTTVTKFAGIAPMGWKAAVNGSVLTFSGGSLGAKTEGKFSFSFTAPKTEGTLLFPTVQTCAKGQTSWIELPLANGKEPKLPAPMVKVSAKA